MSQRTLGKSVGRSQTFVSLVETGKAPSLTVQEAARLCAALGATLVFGLESPRLGESRQRDVVHAICVGYAARRLARAGWVVEREVLAGSVRRPAWIDLLAFHPSARVLLVIEVKTELRDLGELERQLGRYEVEARSLARARGWQARRMLGTVLLLATEVNDARILALRGSTSSAFPVRGRALRELLHGGTDGIGTRGLALIDPRSRRGEWCVPTRSDGRRSPAPYRDYADFIHATQTSRRTARREG